MPFPFEVPFEEVRADLDTYVDAVFGALQSEFLTLPRGEGFLEYPVFETGYEALKRLPRTSVTCLSNQFWKRSTEYLSH